VRLAWFTPLPPVRSGISDYSAEILRFVAPAHEVSVFVATAAEVAWGTTAGLPVRPAHDVVWQHHRRPFDLTVYQLGNAACHDFVWPYLFQYPGLVVLHDAHLHDARAWTLLRRQRRTEYCDELTFNHPSLDPAAASLATTGFAGPLYYCWPMLRTVMSTARTVAVHSAAVAAALAAEYPGAAVEALHMGVSDPRAPEPARAASRAAIRARHGLADHAFVCAAFGGVTPEKRLEQVLHAIAGARGHHPDLHLLLVGPPSPHYDAAAAAAAAGIADRVTVTGFVPHDDLADYLGAADLAFCLRWPTARETSASWLRAIAAGLPTVITDLAHQTDVPTLDPRTWTTQHTSPTLDAPAPVAVGIDILDEDHSLRLALQRLVRDDDLRRRLGTAARAWFEAHHTIERMRADYQRLLGDARARPAPPAVVPAHLRPDPLAHARQLAADAGGSLGDLG
jgi:glycosyltransferase involved in cell wall biosynthesis